MNKTEKAKSLLQGGKFAEALSIIARFRMGFTHEERRTLEIANEVMGATPCSIYGSDLTRTRLSAKQER